MVCFQCKTLQSCKIFWRFSLILTPPPPLHFLGPFRCSFGVLNWNSVQNGALICTFTMIREKEWSVGGMQEGRAFSARVGGVELDPTECSWQICVERAKKVSELSGIRWGMDGPLIKYKMKLLFKKQIPNSNFKQGECTERTGHHTRDPAGSDEPPKAMIRDARCRPRTAPSSGRPHDIAITYYVCTHVVTLPFYSQTVLGSQLPKMAVHPVLRMCFWSKWHSIPDESDGVVCAPSCVLTLGFFFCVRWDDGDHGGGQRSFFVKNYLYFR